MDSRFNCDICSKKSKTSIATKFCNDCEEKLCIECLEFHSALKVLSNHHVVDVSVMTDPYMEVKRFCENHADLPFEFYCSDHDVLCCRSCLTNDHRICEQLTPIEVAAQDVKSSTLFNDVYNGVNHLQQVASELTQSVENAEDLLKKSKMNTIDMVSKFTNKLRTRIDELEIRCVAEINTISYGLIKNATDNKTEVEKIVQRIQNTLQKFELVSKHGSDRQILLLLHSLKIDIDNVDVHLTDFIPSLKTSTIEFEESDVLKIIKSIGTAKVTETGNDFRYKPVKLEKLQPNLKANQVPTKLQLVKRVTVEHDKNIGVVGLCVLGDGRIIFCNNDKSLLVSTDSGHYIQSIVLGANPWNIAVEPHTDYAWITIPEKSYLEIMDTKSLSLPRRVKVSKGCYGIAFVGCDIAVGMCGNVNIVNKQGDCLKSFRLGSKTIESLCYTGTNRLYCCETDKDMVHCISLEGVNVFSYRSADLKGPTCVFKDLLGNMYVLCCISNNLHRLSEDGKFLSIMLNEQDGLSDVYAASFNRNYSKLFIASLSANDLYIFLS